MNEANDPFYRPTTADGLVTSDFACSRNPMITERAKLFVQLINVRNYSVCLSV